MSTFQVLLLNTIHCLLSVGKLKKKAQGETQLQFSLHSIGKKQTYV